MSVFPSARNQQEREGGGRGQRGDGGRLGKGGVEGWSKASWGGGEGGMGRRRQGGERDRGGRGCGR